MRVLLIGGRGQVGTEILRQTQAHGISIHVPDRAYFDLCEPLRLRGEVAGGGYDGVINAAAYTAVDNAENEQQKARLINADSPGQIALGCADAGIPLVHYSTDYVFNGEGCSPYKASDATDPLGVYGTTKRDGETLVNASGATAAIIRLSWVFSAHGNNFVKTMLRLAKTKDSLRVVADQFGKPTPASAAAEAGLITLKELFKNPAKAGTYHFCGDGETHWADFARAIFEKAELKVDVVDITTDQFPTPAKRPTYSVMCTDEIKSRLGISAPSWREHLLDVITELNYKK
ncbi:MAG: dTDP-4-dehydrorhamnose reductase [Henriciella sp.]|nr:dTDP-4-dehydrorhamnose reductase [Henriciella sp.]